MYVKVTAGNHVGGGRGDFLARVHPPLYSDHIAAKLGPNAEWEPCEGMRSGRQLKNPGQALDFEEAIGAHIDFLHLLEFSPEQTEYERNQGPNGLVSFRYVWWEDPDTGLTAVITTRNIFILGENGKTIDRV